MVKQYGDYRNARERYDLESAVSFFAPDAKFTFESSDYQPSLEGVKKGMGWDFTMHATAEWKPVKQYGDTLVVELKEFNDFYRNLGIPFRRMELTYVYRDSLIIHQHLKPLPDDGPTTDEALKPFLAWMTANQNEMLAEIYEDDYIKEFSADGARKWLSAFELWKSALSQDE